jgi:GMP synthase-like glutamine amidotransferase
MRVGLLMCDHVDDRFRAVAGDYDDMFAALLVPHATGELELIDYDAVAGDLPASATECDGWLITGSRYSVYDDEAWIEALCAFVREAHVADVPTVGVCFGHQVIAHALGGRVEKAASGWGVGAQLIEGAQTGRLLFMHQDQVVELPDGMEVVGVADHCPVAALSGGSMLGVQGHPEFTTEYERALLDARVDRIGADQTATARRTLDHATDEAAFARWILDFLEAHR